MSLISFNESLEITIRTYLSMTYLTSAALLAKKAFAIEDGRNFKDRINTSVHEEHQAYSTAAIMMSAAAVEAFVNELFAECRDAGTKNQLNIPPAKAEVLARFWTDEPKFERKPVFEKYDRALALLNLPALDRSSEPFKAASELFELRNGLMHYKMFTHEVGKEPGEQTPDDVEQKLQAYFVDNQLTGPGNPYFPDRVLGHGAAEWSAKTAVAFLDRFCQLLGTTPPYEHLRSTFATR